MVALDTRLGCLEANLPPDSDSYRLIKAADDAIELLFHLDAKFPLWKFITTPSWRRFVKAMDTVTE
jgi:cytochrome P450 family 49 subfamily A